MKGLSDLRFDALLTGRNAILCGFEGSVMHAVAKRLADQGADVVLCATESQQCDALERQGQCDVLVWCMTPLLRISLEETSPSRLAACLEENLLSAWRAVRRVLPGMMARCSGNIVFVGSDLAVEAVPFTAAYATVAGAMVGFMRGVAMDVCRYGIRSNAVLQGMSLGETGDLYLQQCPVLADGDFAWLQPVPRRGTPKDAADAVLYLASDWSGYLTGEWVPVDGGAMVVAHVQDMR